MSARYAADVIPEIDIWRVAYLMLKRYGDEADIESAIRAEEVAEEGRRPPARKVSLGLC